MTMRRYLICFGIALSMHLVLVLPFLNWMHQHLAATGGGAGSSIHIAIEAASAPQQEGLRATPQQAASHPSQGQDLRRAATAGDGFGTSRGPASGPGSSRTGDDQILAQIRALIEAAKRYPLMAQRRGLEGTASVSFQIQADGSIQTLKIIRSSGSDILDEAALQTIKQAAPFPAYPDPIQIGIRFALHETTDM